MKASMHERIVVLVLIASATPCVAFRRRTTADIAKSSQESIRASQGDVEHVYRATDGEAAFSDEEAAAQDFPRLAVIGLAVKQALHWSGHKPNQIVSHVWSPRWADQGLYLQIKDKCGDFLESKDLKDAASSSRSGSKFFDCRIPEPGSDYPRFLVKGKVKNSEWDVFTRVQGALKYHYEHQEGPTLLNRMVFGFDAFRMHWLVMEDLSAEPLVWHLRRWGLAPTTRDVKWRKYDIKPWGNRSPQRGACLHDLREVSQQVGQSLEEFVGWTDIVSAWNRDKVFLKSQGIIDESFLIQVAGPFKINVDQERFAKGGGEDALKHTLFHVPTCAYRLDFARSELTLVCVSVIDYFMDFTLMHHVQNAVQMFRWNNYEEKVTNLLECIGDISRTACANYREEADRSWQDHLRRNIGKSALHTLQQVERTHRCCCQTGSRAFSNGLLARQLSPGTPCKWQRYGSQASWVDRTFGLCEGSLHHVAASDGGCSYITLPTTPHS